MEPEAIDEPLTQQLAKARKRMAELAEELAKREEEFGAYLETAADRGDRERRLAKAASEWSAAIKHRLLADQLRRRSNESGSRDAATDHLVD